MLGVHVYGTLEGGVARRWGGRSTGTTVPLDMMTTEET